MCAFYFFVNPFFLQFEIYHIPYGGDSHSWNFPQSAYWWNIFQMHGLEHTAKIFHWVFFFTRDDILLSILTFFHFQVLVKNKKTHYFRHIIFTWRQLCEKITNSVFKHDQGYSNGTYVFVFVCIYIFFIGKDIRSIRASCSIWYDKYSS